MLEQGDRLLPLGCGERGVGWIGGIEQLYQRRCQLLGGAALGLGLEGVPLAVVDREKTMQRLRGVATVLWPLLTD